MTGRKFLFPSVAPFGLFSRLLVRWIGLGFSGELHSDAATGFLGKAMVVFMWKDLAIGSTIPGRQLEIVCSSDSMKLVW